MFVRNIFDGMRRPVLKDLFDLGVFTRQPFEIASEQ